MWLALLLLLFIPTYACLLMCFGALGCCFVCIGFLVLWSADCGLLVDFDFCGFNLSMLCGFDLLLLFEMFLCVCIFTMFVFT